MFELGLARCIYIYIERENPAEQKTRTFQSHLAKGGSVFAPPEPGGGLGYLVGEVEQNEVHQLNIYIYICCSVKMWSKICLFLSQNVVQVFSFFLFCFSKIFFFLQGE